LESREVIAVEALKQAKDEHVQKLMEAYLVTHNQRRALRIQEPVQLEEEFDRILPSQSPPEEVINISSLLTHPGDISD
jgi:hypothetical protein